MRRAAGVAAGFALGVALFGFASIVSMLVSRRLPSDAEGSAAAAALFSALGFGSLAIAGGIAAGVVVGAFHRWFFDVRDGAAVRIGLVAGIAVGLCASFGLLRLPGAMFISSMLAGAMSGVVLIAASAAARAAGVLLRR